jgi:hypothetical protein
MQRKVRTPNPYFKAIAVDWKLHLLEPDGGKKTREGELEMSFRSRDDKGCQTTLTFPCHISKRGCSVTKVGTRKKENAEGKCTRKRKFSIIRRMDKDPENRSLAIFNRIVNAVAKNIGLAVGSLREYADIKGTLILPPKLFKIPKWVTIKWVSLDKLKDAGQI